LLRGSPPQTTLHSTCVDQGTKPVCTSTQPSSSEVSRIAYQCPPASPGRGSHVAWDPRSHETRRRSQLRFAALVELECGNIDQRLHFGVASSNGHDRGAIAVADKDEGAVQLVEDSLGRGPRRNRMRKTQRFLAAMTALMIAASTNAQSAPAHKAAVSIVLVHGTLIDGPSWRGVYRPDQGRLSSQHRAWS
jgi:hypothetical protein